MYPHTLHTLQKVDDEDEEARLDCPHIIYYRIVERGRIIIVKYFIIKNRGGSSRFFFMLRCPIINGGRNKYTKIQYKNQARTTTAPQHDDNNDNNNNEMIDVGPPKKYQKLCCTLYI